MSGGMGMRVAVVGSSGYIAGYLISSLQKKRNVEEIVRIGRGEKEKLDLLCPEAFDYRVLNGLDYVIFTAAVSGPDQCARDYEQCWAVNVSGTEFFIERALRAGCRVLFFSSDAVYGDAADGIFTEELAASPSTPYGEMKKHVEDSFADNPAFKAIRLSYVVSAQDKFVSFCLRCIREGQEADIFHPFYRSCITVSDVVQTVEWLMEHWDRFVPATLNVAGTELVSRVQIADELNRLYDGRLKYKIIAPPEEFYKNRPRIAQMESLYLYDYKIVEPLCFARKLRKELEEE